MLAWLRDNSGELFEELNFPITLGIPSRIREEKKGRGEGEGCQVIDKEEETKMAGDCLHLLPPSPRGPHLHRDQALFEYILVPSRVIHSPVS